MKNRTTIWLFVLMVFIVPFTAYSGLQWYNKRYQRLPILGQLGEHGESKELVLVNQDGQQISTAKWKDDITVVDFFFTRCPSICPKMTKNLQRLRQKFPGDSAIQLYSITVDPEHDSSAQLRSYAKRFNLDLNYWNLLTGNKREIYLFARNQFKVVSTDGDGGPADFIHSEQLILLDKQLRIRGYYKGTDDDQVDKLILDIKKLKYEKE